MVLFQGLLGRHQVMTPKWWAGTCDGNAPSVAFTNPPMEADCRAWMSSSMPQGLTPHDMAEVLRLLVRCIDTYPQIVKNTR